MSDSLLPFSSLLFVYVALVLCVGIAATRRAGRSPEDYFLAGRGLGTAVLFMALFGTNCTAFVLVGVPGRAYHDGIGVFGVNAPIIALGIPLSFWAIGAPARSMARRLGAMTPAELYARRLDSRAVGILLFLVYTAYTLPYMVTAVDGAALTLEHATHGALGSIWGGSGVLVVALLYTSLGGMRATAWTNVVQGTLFMGFMLVAFWLVSRSMGGLAEATERVRERAPQLLVRGDTGLFAPRAWASWGLAISLTVIAFPHMLVRLFSARSERSLVRICQLYPVALLCLWLPAVLLGVWGAAEFPGLEGRASDEIFSLMTAEHLPPWLALFGSLAVLSAVMSTLDAQLLTLGSMLTRDVLDPIRGEGRAQRDVHFARLFGVVVAGAVFLLWQLYGRSIYTVASVAFSGYVTLTPTLLCGVRWRRFNAAGAIASIVAGNAAYLACLAEGGGPAAAMRPSWGGFLPVFWAFVAASCAAAIVPMCTGGCSSEHLDRAFGCSASGRPTG